MHFIIYDTLPSLNDYTKANRHNRFTGGNMKKNVENKIIEFIKKSNLKKVEKYPVYIDFKWYEPTNRRDADNVVFAKKFIQDALVSAGILENDSRKYIKGFTDTVETDKDNPRIEVHIGNR